MIQDISIAKYIARSYLWAGLLGIISGVAVSIFTLIPVRINIEVVIYSFLISELATTLILGTVLLWFRYHYSLKEAKVWNYFVLLIKKIRKFLLYSVFVMFGLTLLGTLVMSIVIGLFTTPANLALFIFSMIISFIVVTGIYVQFRMNMGAYDA